MDTVANIWSQQPDAGSPYAYDTHPVFLAKKKTGSSPIYPHALYHGHYLYFFAVESTGILRSGEYTPPLYKPYYDNTHYLDDNRGNINCGEKTEDD